MLISNLNLTLNIAEIDRHSLKTARRKKNKMICSNILLCFFAFSINMDISAAGAKNVVTVVV